MSKPDRWYDEATVTAAADGVREAFPEVARLLEALWAEVGRVTAPEYVPPVPMTEADRTGPFLARPEVDVEFVDVHGAPLGSSTVGLGLRLNERGILIISETMIVFTAERETDIGGYRIWIGGDLIKAVIDPVHLMPPDTYAIAFNLPIKIGRDIDHSPGNDRGPPRPMPTPPSRTRTPTQV